MPPVIKNQFLSGLVKKVLWSLYTGTNGGCIITIAWFAVVFTTRYLKIFGLQSICNIIFLLLLCFHYLHDIVVESLKPSNMFLFCFVFSCSEKLLIGWEIVARSQPIAESQCEQEKVQPTTSTTMFPSLAHSKMTAASWFSVLHQNTPPLTIL